MSLCPIEKKFIDSALQKRSLHDFLKAVIRYAHSRKPEEKQYEIVEKQITKQDRKGGPA